MKDQENPLDMLDNVEDIQTVLSDEELMLINIVFSELEGFDQITDDLEKALSKNIITHNQLTKIFKIITKTVYYKISLKMNTPAKKGLARTFFELPEIISKRLRVYMYRNLLQQSSSQGE